MILCFQDMLRVATCQLAHLGTGMGWGRLRYFTSLNLHFPTCKMGTLKGSWKTPWTSHQCLQAAWSGSCVAALLRHDLLMVVGRP